MENPIKSTDSYCFSVLFVSLVTCGNKNPESDIRESDIGSGEKEFSSSSLKAIVVYFSASGHTQKVSETIADYLSLPIYELEPVNPYTDDDLNYSNSSSRVVKEHQQRLNGEELTVALKETHLEGFEEADYVFLGAPVWWQELSWVVEDFVRNNDFSGKTILPLRNFRFFLLFSFQSLFSIQRSNMGRRKAIPFQCFPILRPFLD